jgi:DNA polymerase III subunit delta'
MARASASQDAEALPEADRLEGFPHPRETSQLFGHAAAEQRLAEAFESGRMHHAWLLAGPAGIGKATLAYKVARYVLARPEERTVPGKGLDVAPQSAAARQVDALSHVGLLLLRRPYDTRAKRFATAIPVDEVRRLKSFVGLTAGEKTWRVVIVDSADDLNINAANALLKTLEEPPARVLFLLVSSEPSGLLPTIRSRCRRLDLHPLSPEPLREAADAALSASELEAPSAKEWEQLASISRGSVRRALQLVASGGLELHQQLAGIFAALPALNWTSAHNLADSLAPSAQEQRFEIFFDLLLDEMAQYARARTLRPAVGQATPSEALLAHWAEAWEAVLRDKADAAELNLDRKALILRTFGRLEAASRLLHPK